MCHKADEALEFCACLISGAKARSERKVRYMLTEDENVHVLQRYAYYGEDVRKLSQSAEEAQRLLVKLKAYLK